jgi:hypothetical protein
VRRNEHGWQVQMTSEPVAPVRLGLVIGLVAAVLLAAVCGRLGYQQDEARQAEDGL